MTTSTSRGDCRHRRRRRRSGSSAAAPPPPPPLGPVSPADEAVFLEMQLRRLERDLRGVQAKGRVRRLHHGALLLVLGAVYGLGAAYVNDDGTLTATLTLQVWQLVAVGGWFLLIVLLLSLLADSVLFAAAVWMLVYWPLAAIVASLFVTGGADHQDPVAAVVASGVGAGLLVMELLTLGVVLLRHVAYPRLLRSDWFRTHIGAARYWSLQAAPDNGGTLTYSLTPLAGLMPRAWQRRSTCRYEGDRHPSSHLPHGASGRWVDDSHGGEVLAGRWRHGRPAAPFLSRRYGTGDAFRGVAVAYVLATDDPAFQGDGTQQLVPTNAEEPRCGVAAVECSVQGAFYNHLPAARPLHGPYRMVEDGASDEGGNGDDDMDSDGDPDTTGAGKAHPEALATSTLGACLRRMARGAPEATEDSPRTVTIASDDPRGVRVLGHVHAGTGLPYEEATARVVVEVVHGPDEEDGEAAKPRADAQHTPQLRVQDWIRSPRKEALVFIPGFNSCLERSLQMFGQLLAMTKLSSRVYPVLFEWPVGQVLTYRYSSAISASPRNREIFLRMLRSLRAAGIGHVHLMSHSMGVQTLLAAFQNRDDGSRSDVSLCFRLDGSTDDNKARDTGDDTLMTCQSITMLNPDFPVKAFVDHAFRSIRRVCGRITIVGDRRDQALWSSQLINGTLKRFGRPPPSLLCGHDDQDKTHLVMGRHIELLYAPVPIRSIGKEPSVDEECAADDDADAPLDRRLLFQKRASQLAVAVVEEEMEEAAKEQQRQWLDVDVIDTTLLDTHIKDLRHSGFNVNPILLKDLEELVLTGRRAAERSTLLYREGNLFSYCHAPAFVKM